MRAFSSSNTRSQLKTLDVDGGLFPNEQQLVDDAAGIAELGRSIAELLEKLKSDVLTSALKKLQANETANIFETTDFAEEYDEREDRIVIKLGRLKHLLSAVGALPP